MHETENIEERIQNVIEHSVGEEFRTMSAELQALRSQVTAMKQTRSKTPTSSPAPTPTGASSTAKSRPTPSGTGSSGRKRSHNNNNTGIRTSTTTARSSSTSSRTGGATGTNSNVVPLLYGRSTGAFRLRSNHAPSPRNRFRLPAVDKKFLDAIEKGDFVDFDKMKKKKLNHKSKEDTSVDYDLQLKEPRNSTDSTLCLKKSKKDKVNTFVEWLSVWNDFLHARLHFQPDEAYELLSYQKNITAFAKQYKFEAVKAYDIDFRHLIANEKSYIDDDRTAFWDLQNTELKNLNLVDNPIPAPECYNCREKGHLSSECLKPSKKIRLNFPPPPSQKYNQFQAVTPQRPGTLSPNFQNYQGYPNAYFPSGQPATGGNAVRAPQPSAMRAYAAANNGNAAAASASKTSNSPFCNNYNATGVCPRGFRCRYYHACNKCHEEGHAGIACLQYTSSGFRPSG